MVASDFKRKAVSLGVTRADNRGWWALHPQLQSEERDLPARYSLGVTRREMWGCFLRSHWKDRYLGLLFQARAQNEKENNFSSHIKFELWRYREAGISRKSYNSSKKGPFASKFERVMAHQGLHMAHLPAALSFLHKISAFCHSVSLIKKRCSLEEVSWCNISS